MKSNYFQAITMFLLFMCSVTLSFGQITKANLIDIITDADYILEGKVIRSDSYWNQNNDFIYTSQTIEISKLFKGSLNCGTVEILTVGGRVGDMELYVSHNLQFRVGEVGLFFCNPTTFEMPSIDYYTESNDDVLEVSYSEQGYLKYFADNFNPIASNLFYQFDSLVQVYDIVELATQLQYTDCNPTIAAPFQGASYRSYKKVKQKALQEKIAKRQKYDQVDFPPSEYRDILNEKRKNISLNKQLNAGDTLVYTFANPIITGTSPQYLEFDIMLRANDNDTYLDNAAAHIELDPNIFGTDVVTNGKVTATRGNMILSPTDYYDPFLVGISSTVLGVAVSAQLNPTNRSQLTTSLQQAAHVKIEIQDCNQVAFLYFTNPSLMLNSAIYSLAPNGNTLWGFTKINAQNVLSSDLCLPQITSVSPSIVRGGVGDILTIYGTGFGATQGTGKVLFLNADDNASWSPLDKRDSIFWSDNMIQVRVPSIVEGAMIDGNAYKGTPGSGIIQILTNNGYETNNSNNNAYVEVVYSIRNYIDTTTNQKHRADVAGIIDASGYEFFPNAALFNDTFAYAIVLKGLNDWRCYSHINFSMNNNPIAQTTFRDTLNTIRFGTTFGPDIQAQTTIWNNYCPTTNRFYQPEIDITFRYPNNWWYDTSAVAPSPSLLDEDLYQIVLHELTHAGLGNHVIDSLSVVSWNSEERITHRAINLYADSAMLGNIDVIQHSDTIVSCSAIKHVPSFNCYGTNAVEPIRSSNLFAIYPNPTNDRINIDISKAERCNIDIIVFDNLGRKLKQVTTLHDGVISFSLKDYPIGVYFIKVFYNNKVFTSKILKL